MKISVKAGLLAVLPITCLTLLGCSSATPTAAPAAEAEPEAIARTEFTDRIENFFEYEPLRAGKPSQVTDRIENFFEYEPLRAGKPSQVRIHLTDLSDGAPLEQAQVTLIVRPAGATDPATETTARVGKVTGIYVADLNIPRAGEYDIEFHIKNAKVDERLPLAGFKVE
jgi:hypothetical protein